MRSVISSGTSKGYDRLVSNILSGSAQGYSSTDEDILESEDVESSDIEYPETEYPAPSYQVQPMEYPAPSYQAQPTTGLQVLQIVEMTDREPGETDQVFSMRKDLFDKISQTQYQEYADSYSMAIVKKMNFGVKYDATVESAMEVIAQEIGVTLG